MRGTSPTPFAPNIPSTREQMAAMLWRYAGGSQYPSVLRWCDGRMDRVELHLYPIFSKDVKFLKNLFGLH